VAAQVDTFRARWHVRCVCVVFNSDKFRLLVFVKRLCVLIEDGPSGDQQTVIGVVMVRVDFIRLSVAAIFFQQVRL
jgi:hypothetical protein